MKSIRPLMFESNSSSSHSICIENAPKSYKTIGLNEDGNIVLNGGEFGWEVESYNSPLIKANYCAIDQCNEDGPDRDMLVKVIKEHTGAKDVIFNFYTDYSTDLAKENYSYIDHQSLGTASDAFESEQTLKDFIFGSGSVLYTDNDND